MDLRVHHQTTVPGNPMTLPEPEVTYLNMLAVIKRAIRNQRQRLHQVDPARTIRKSPL